VDFKSILIFNGILDSRNGR